MSDAWLMESDFCDCGALLQPDDTDGLCPVCSELYLMQEDDEAWYFDEDEDDRYADSGDYDERAYLMGEYD